MTNSSGVLPEQDLRRAAADAIADVDSLGLQGEDRSIVLRSLLNARLAGRQQAPMPSRIFQDAPREEEREIVGDSDMTDKLGLALNVERELIELVYDFRDGEPEVVISAKKIASNRAEGTRQLAQLVCVGRQVLGLEDWTSAATIRSIVAEFGRLDSSNFASTLQQMDSVALIRGKGQQREVKITKPGIENTADLIRSLVGA